MKPITVAELIAALQKQPQDALVLSEGCDCDGFATGAELVPAYKWTDIIKDADGDPIEWIDREADVVRVKRRQG